jgi:thiol-disulfide isomerase/thioredoxin
LKTAARRRAFALLLLFGAGSLPAASSPSRLAGELDAAGLRQAIAREKGRVLLVNFWATWCVPCREEFPDLSRLQERNHAAGLRVVGISTDFASQKAAVEKFLAEKRPAFPNYRKKSGGDDQNFIEAVDPAWGGELPFSVLYDRSGRKVKSFSGKFPIASTEREIRKLLGAS